MTEREKVIYSIERCICHVPDACSDCAYDAEHPYPECEYTLLQDALELLKDPDRVKVVRCAECICWEAPSAIEKRDGSTMGHCRNHYGACANEQTDASWFCADGEREG